jgi:arylsulfatase A-like enzyme
MDALRTAERGYYGGITGMDMEFARILKALEENGQAANTIVVYSSDHGEMMGGHCRMSKIVPWEESCHVPFYVRIPGARNRGKSSPEQIAAIDIYPTLCGLVGIPIPAHCKGRDMSPVLRGDGRVAAVDGVIVMGERGGASEEENDIPSYRGIRTETHTYAVTEDGRWILYDNVADPFQMNNLAGDPAHADLMKKLDKQIMAWQASVGDQFPLEAAAAKVSKYPS